MGSDDDGRAEVAAFVVAFGADVSLSASDWRRLDTRLAGALANVADDVTGMDMLGGSAGEPATAEPAAGEFAAARFADDGGAAGVRPAMATGCGVD